ncbi:hypothetical protein [Cognatishimia activa]|uniref:Uncharacterized protein n=1 Tax=Cognatishimia activa TaxID=1715691 RepID=A0A0P1IU63_9RHOB|nr:hypothetical protein [Cognatishimia activa]CUJ33091.1 hypothetical protein TA5113_03059 [Cognatishimia activa]CUK27123.1 hypothetical protein TA5114_02944 [Cognatishimia activa]
MNQIINMIMRRVMRQLVNKGVNAGFDAVSKRGDADESRSAGNGAPKHNAKQAKQAMRMIRRTSRF